MCIRDRCEIVRLQCVMLSLVVNFISYILLTVDAWIIIDLRFTTILLVLLRCLTFLELLWFGMGLPKEYFWNCQSSNFTHRPGDLSVANLQCEMWNTTAAIPCLFCFTVSDILCILQQWQNRKTAQADCCNSVANSSTRRRNNNINITMFYCNCTGWAKKK